MPTPGPMFDLKNVKNAKVNDNVTTGTALLKAEDVDNLEALRNQAGGKIVEMPKAEARPWYLRFGAWALENMGKVIIVVIGAVAGAIAKQYFGG